ncbi:hypothetical protein GGR58DRAFT_458784 [Xylaria digitata]|nr:hypothetical protein GGR58DRAFT_458784 [Xylaria digitata]
MSWKSPHRDHPLSLAATWLTSFCGSGTIVFGPRLSFPLYIFIIVILVPCSADWIQILYSSGLLTSSGNIKYNPVSNVERKPQRGEV